MHPKRRNLLVAAGVGLLVVVGASLGIAALIAVPTLAVPSTSGPTPSVTDMPTVSVDQGSGPTSYIPDPVLISPPPFSPPQTAVPARATTAKVVAKATSKPAVTKTTAAAVPKVTAAPATQAAAVTIVSFTCITKVNTTYAALTWIGKATGTITLPGGQTWSSGPTSSYISGYGKQGVIKGTCTATVGGVTKTVTVS